MNKTTEVLAVVALSVALVSTASRKEYDLVSSTGLLHACGIALGLLHGFGWGGHLVRLAGAFVIAGGLYFLWQCLG